VACIIVNRPTLVPEWISQKVSLDKLFPTGRIGSIGNNFVRYVLEEDLPSLVVSLDNLNNGGLQQNLSDIQSDRRYRFVRGDIADRHLIEKLLAGSFLSPRRMD